MNDPMQTLIDVMDPARARAMQALLGAAPTIAEGDALPPFFHQLYFWDPQPPHRLGRDGHPKLGGIIPDMGLPRRMWAGGRLRFQLPLRAGQVAERRTVLEKAERKDGRTSPLAFVTLRHEIWQGGQVCVTDWQDVLYREDPDPAAPAPVPPMARTDAAVSEEETFNSTLLFRYSALTFNGHRIHYDTEYAREVEGYGGLVVHGPLLAQKLMLLAERQIGSLSEFSFRATAPLVHTETARFCWNDGTVWVAGPDGRQCMIATARG